MKNRLEAASIPEPNSGCWLWLKGANTAGYGYIKVEGKQRRAHIVCYEENVGPVPAGLVLDHKCRVKSCINPAHLEPVTDRENILRGEGLAAKNAAKLTCLRGHDLIGENMFIDSAGKRQCRICRRESWRRHYHAHKRKK